MNQQQNKRRRKKRPLNLPAVMFFGLLITCAVVIAVVAGRNLLHKGDDLLQGKDSGTTLAADLETSGAHTESQTNRSGDTTYENSETRQNHGSTGPSSNIDRSQWNLTLVNKWNLLPESHNPSLTQLKNGHAIDERAYPDLQDMMDDCRAAGLNTLICSLYRTMDKQKKLYKNKVDEYLAQGYSQESAEAAAGELVAVPGTSEHQLGLALDIVDEANQVLDEHQENTEVQKWLMKNSWKYGFILRYPTDKSDITGISYEPWHYRYVGKEAAKEIYEAGICLEEYLNA